MEGDTMTTQLTGHQLDRIEIQAGSIEYLQATVTADVTLDNTVAVALSLTPLSTGAHDWKPAGWIGTAGTTRVAQTTDPLTYVAGNYTVFVKLTDTPEIPILAAYAVTVPAP
jgi:hypothetical protein